MTHWKPSLALAATVVALASTTQGVVLDPNTIAVWPEPVPLNAAEYLAVKFKPTLDVVNGCQPYPAVDPDGNTSGGLRTTGASNGSCGDKSKAQVYARSGFYGDAYAIMYAWYMAKDSPSPLLGHRHDWEHAVVWLDSNDVATATVIALMTSAHGKAQKSYPVDGNYIADGVSAKISYKSMWPLNHALGFTKKVGAKQPVIQWEQLTDAARNALEATSFGDATVPFKSNFESNLAQAYFK